jgi:hypothetical protein
MLENQASASGGSPGTADSGTPLPYNGPASPFGPEMGTIPGPGQLADSGGVANLIQPSAETPTGTTRPGQRRVLPSSADPLDLGPDPVAQEFAYNDPVYQTQGAKFTQDIVNAQTDRGIGFARADQNYDRAVGSANTTQQTAMDRLMARYASMGSSYDTNAFKNLATMEEQFNTYLAGLTSGWVNDKVDLQRGFVKSINDASLGRGQLKAAEGQAEVDRQTTAAKEAADAKAATDAAAAEKARIEQDRADRLAANAAPAPVNPAVAGDPAMYQFNPSGAATDANNTKMLTAPGLIDRINTAGPMDANWLRAAAADVGLPQNVKDAIGRRLIQLNTGTSEIDTMPPQPTPVPSYRPNGSAY